MKYFNPLKIFILVILVPAYIVVAIALLFWCGIAALFGDLNVTIGDKPYRCWASRNRTF